MFFLLLMQEYLKFTLIWNDLNVYILWFCLCLLTFCYVYFVMFTFVEFPQILGSWEWNFQTALPLLRNSLPQTSTICGILQHCVLLFPFPSQRSQASSSQAPSTVSIYVAEVACYKLNFSASNFGVCSCHPFFQVSAFLLHHFSEVADYSFTANMETEVVNISQFMVSVCFFVFSLCHSFRNLLKLAGQWLLLWVKPILEFRKSVHLNGHWYTSNIGRDYSWI